MDNIFALFKIPSLRNKLLFSILMVGIYRFGSFLPISGINVDSFSHMFDSGNVFGFLNLFSGGGLKRFSVFALGILPYINASIIMQLLTVVWPKIKEIQEEGESGRKQISQYTRYLAVGLSVVQAFVLTLGFQQFIDPDVSVVFFSFYSVVSLVAGAALVMWLGELITEFGIGNGASILIFVGIVAQMPLYIQETIDAVQTGTPLPNVLFLIFVFLLIIVAIVFFQEAERQVPVRYTSTNKSAGMLRSTYLPLRLIQGGVMPIIFSSAVLQFPLLFSSYIPFQQVQNFFSLYYRYDGLLYNGLFCVLIFFFAFFYTAISFNPEEISDNIKRSGGFIMGVRPGSTTVSYLDSIISRLTLIGASFLGLVAVVPVLVANLTQVKSFMGLGGTALIIIVGVALDLVKQIDVFIISHKYDGIMK